MSLESLPIARDVPTITAAQMAEADRVATTELGIPLEALMENAGRQVASAARTFLDGDVEGKLVAAMVGSGNNGGDALAALRHLAGWGAEVDAYIAEPRRLHTLAQLQYDILARLGVALYDATTLDDRFLAHRLSGRHLILDGLLGYSTTGAPRGQIDRLIRVANVAGANAPVLAVDLPSGLDPDTGAALGTDAIRAALTVTLALPKAGLVRREARGAVGRLLLADIGIPPKAYETFGLHTNAVFAAGDLVRIIL
jgi:NAD(P)H-hydrate epimerase